jgi:hypothetical protein
MAFREIEQDLQAGLLIYTRVSWTDVFRLADELSDKHSGNQGQRTIDLLPSSTSETPNFHFVLTSCALRLCGEIPLRDLPTLEGGIARRTQWNAVRRRR